MNKTLLLVASALIAFAANSILCRYALGDNSIDPISFTLIRLVSGALLLTLLFIFFNQEKDSEPGTIIAKANISANNLLGAVYLLLYALTFSFAYITLDTATGALLLFGTVQLCMIGIALFKGKRLSGREWLGVTTACAGFLILTVPHVTTPSLSGLVLMVMSGLGWGLYTLNGKDSVKPLKDTMINFNLASLLAIPIGGLVLTLSQQLIFLSIEGVTLAIASGALASALGYAIWYAVLPMISTTQAATSQLLVPVIAAIGGLLLLQEALSLLTIMSGIIMLSGIYLVIQAKAHADK